MSFTKLRTVVARAIVDKDFRKRAFAEGADLGKALKDAGYDLTNHEIALLSCNSEQSFDDNFVTIDNWEQFWKASEDRLVSILTNRKPEAGPLNPGNIAEGV